MCAGVYPLKGVPIKWHGNYGVIIVACKYQLGFECIDILYNFIVHEAILILI